MNRRHWTAQVDVKISITLVSVYSLRSPQWPMIIHIASKK